MEGVLVGLVKLGGGKVIGIGLTQEKSSTFSVLDVGFHGHEGDSDPQCGFRSGVYLTLLSFNIAVGVFYS